MLIARAKKKLELSCAKLRLAESSYQLLNKSRNCNKVVKKIDLRGGMAEHNLELSSILPLITLQTFL